MYHSPELSALARRAGKGHDLSADAVRGQTGVAGHAPVLTPHGPKRADALCVGDQIMTAGGRAHPVLWIRRHSGRRVSAINAGTRPVVVGCEQQLVVTDPLLSAALGSARYCVAAHDIAETTFATDVTLVEFLLPVVAGFCVGTLPVASFLPDGPGLSALDDREREDLFKTVPNLRHLTGRARYQPLAPRLTQSDMRRTGVWLSIFPATDHAG